MKKFTQWIESNDKKQRGVAQKLEISTSTLHDILRKDHMPSLLLAYKIEQYTGGAITVYDWIDEQIEQNIPKRKANEKTNKIGQ